MPRYSLYARPFRPMTLLWHCLNCHEDTHSHQQYRHSFINASGCLNPDLGQLGDDGEAYRRWQARTIRYHREGKSSRSHKKNHKHNRRRRDNSRGQHQSQGQHTTQNDGFNTHAEQGNQQSGSGDPGGVPASSDVVPFPGFRYGASRNPGGNPNTRQPGNFRTGN